MLAAAAGPANPGVSGTPRLLGDCDLPGQTAVHDAAAKIQQGAKHISENSTAGYCGRTCALAQYKSPCTDADQDNSKLLVP